MEVINDISGVKTSEDIHQPDENAVFDDISEEEKNDKTVSDETSTKEKTYEEKVMDDLAIKMQHRLMRKVRIKNHKVTINFTDTDDLNYLLELLHLENVINEDS